MTHTTVFIFADKIHVSNYQIRIPEDDLIKEFHRSQSDQLTTTMNVREISDDNGKFSLSATKNVFIYLFRLSSVYSRCSES
jgi:hypothetical protein